MKTLCLPQMPISSDEHFAVVPFYFDTGFFASESGRFRAPDLASSGALT
jgi:hypothetical protein